jgi:hypothetical protein
MSGGAGSDTGPGTDADASGGVGVDRASSEPDAAERAEGSVDAPSGAAASASAEADGALESAAHRGPSSGGQRGSSVVGALSRRVHAARASATDAARIRGCGFTTRQGKPAFVLGEHPIVSLLTFALAEGANGFVPTAPRGTKPA